MENNRNPRRARLIAAGIVVLFGAPLLSAPVSFLVSGVSELGLGMPLLWGALSLSFGVHAAGDYLAARARRKPEDAEPRDDEKPSASRKAA